MKRFVKISVLLTICIFVYSCGAGISKFKEGDLVVFNAQTIVGASASKYDKLIDIAIDGDNNETMRMIYSGDARCVFRTSTGKVVRTNNKYVQIKLDEDNKYWWVAPEFIQTEPLIDDFEE